MNNIILTITPDTYSLKKKKNHAMKNTNISIKRNEKKKTTRTKLNTYLHECTLQWKNTLEIQEIFTSLRSKIFYLQERNY